MASRAHDVDGSASRRVRGGGGGPAGVNFPTFPRMFFNVKEVGPNVNGVILLGGLFVNVSVFNTLTLLVD